MNIAIDMMGGDYAPEEAVKGIGVYLNSMDAPSSLTLIGDEVMVIPFLDEFNIDRSLITLVHASDVIGMHEHPTKALKEKPDSSISKGFQLLATNQCDAFISAGNTGAMMVGSLFSIKAIQGILRPSIGAYLPREDGTLGLLLDVGLNSDCKPENLLQFAQLGSLYAENILNISNPKVGLINLGEEEGKGNLLTQAAYGLLKECKKINFIGNLEGRDLLINKADVMVCDGFTGNVLLKFAESFHDLTVKRSIKDQHFDRFNFEMYGGVPVLGVRKPVIIGHGISHANAFMNMIVIAEKMIRQNMTGLIEKQFCDTV